MKLGKIGGVTKVCVFERIKISGLTLQLSEWIVKPEKKRLLLTPVFQAISDSAVFNYYGQYHPPCCVMLIWDGEEPTSTDR